MLCEEEELLLDEAVKRYGVIDSRLLAINILKSGIDIGIEEDKDKYEVFKK